MHQRNLILGLALCAATLSAGLARGEGAAEAIERKVFEITGKDTAVLTFARGSAKIADGDETKLRAVVDAMRNAGPVKEILILSYADLAYPRNRKSDLPSASIDLADKRAEAVKKQLEAIGAEHLSVHNMAKKANWLERNFVTSDAQVKREAAEKPAKTDADDAFYQSLGQRLKSEGGAGKVVVVVRHEGTYAH